MTAWSEAPEIDRLSWRLYFGVQAEAFRELLIELGRPELLAEIRQRAERMQEIVERAARS